MAYAEFTVRSATAAFGLTLGVGPLFAGLPPADVPDWLRQTLDRGRRMPLASEKARGELLVMPILLACGELVPGPVSIYSGVRMDVDPKLGLSGECDFVLARTPPFPELMAPLVALVEAEDADIDLGLGQCIAQMVGARLWNECDGKTLPAVYGCVTTGQDWQFLRLCGGDLTFDDRRYFLPELGDILAVFRVILAPPGAAP